jgi:hypothetical protein
MRHQSKEGQFRGQLKQVKQLVQNALTLSAATGTEEVGQTDGDLSVKIRSMSEDFNFFTPGREGTGLEISGLRMGTLGDTIRAVRSLARTFNAKVSTEFNGTPMTSLPRSTGREVGLDWSYRRVLHQHPEIHP